MTQSREFDEDAVIEGQADEVVQAMARRQFAVSLAVGFALLAIAGLTLVRPGASRDVLQETASRHRVVPAESRPVDVAQPVQQTAPRG